MKQLLQVMGLTVLIATISFLVVWKFRLAPHNDTLSQITGGCTGIGSFVIAHLWVYRKDWFSK